MKSLAPFIIISIQFLSFACSGSIADKFVSNGIITYYTLDEKPIYATKDSTTGRLSGLPVVIEKTTPSFHPLAIRGEVEGNVVIKAWVNTDGKPQKIQIVTSDADIHIMNSMEALKHWVFKPFTINGSPTEFIAIVPFRFVFNNGQPQVIVPE
jgi:hypothetical protein